MNLGIILPLIIYLTFFFGAAIFCLCKTYKRRFFNRILCRKSLNDGVCTCNDHSLYLCQCKFFFVGGPGAAYKYGLGWVLLAMIQVPAVWLALGALGKKIRTLIKRNQCFNH